jgi:hypothetical protein
MADFMMLIRDPEPQDISPEDMQAIIEKYSNWAQSLRDRGIYKGADPLATDGRVLHSEGGSVIDGPFTETKEAVGGYFIVEAADYDEAVTIGRECPCFIYGGKLEIRRIGH